MVAALGSTLGSVLTVALLVLGALVFLPKAIFPDSLGVAILAGALPFGPKLLVVALLGVVATLAGASIETALSGAYNVCQFLNIAWGKKLEVKKAPIYTVAWLGMFVLATIIAATGVDPLQLVNVSIVFGMVVMPFTYYPILRVAADKKIMGKHANSKTLSAVGGVFLLLIVAAAAAAIPLMILTHFGQP
jgi:Mn2+/Fe2+ NRAMP family transporter